MSKIKLTQKLRYRFDNTMSRGSGALILWLGILTAVLIILASLIVIVFSVFPESEEGSSMGIGETLWQILMRAMDAGTVAGDVGWGFRILMFIVTLGGIFILSTLIGILSSGIGEKLDELRKGRSFVVEKNHQLILGWNSKVFTIIDELATANINQKRPRIVIMAPEDKTMMEEEIRRNCLKLGHTKVICRSGDTNDAKDLSIVNLNEAKSIVVLSSENTSDADAQMIKVLLAIVHHPDRKEDPFHIVAEIKEQKNVLLGQIVAKDEVELLLTDDLVSRIMVQTCRQSGLSIVYTEITGFDGDEIYIIEEPKHQGNSFGDILFKYNDSSILGVQLYGKKIQLNPPMDLLIEEGIKLVVLTADNDSLIINAPIVTINETAITFVGEAKQETEKTLILNWNKKGPAIVREMGTYVPKGSELLIVSGHKTVEANYKKSNISDNLSVRVLEADPSDRELLEQLHVFEFTQIIVLSDTENQTLQEADSQTLITLLHLRDLLNQTKNNVRIVSEILDVRNRELASVTKADDFVISDKLIAQMVSQVSETKELVQIFDDLFDATGSEIYVKSMSNYINSGHEIDFFTVLESAKRQNQIAIGYRIMAKQYDKEACYGIVLNPLKSEKVTFAPDDKIIILAAN
jgi:voltage-gated potassium channel Kch